MQEGQGKTFDAVLEEELQEIKRRRDEDLKDTGSDVYEKALDNELVGLAFSGGGIRSATFNLGILQTLAKLKLLGKFDYLSTVSGGGYIGSWLSSWIHRESLEGVEEKLHTRTVTASQHEEHRPLMFLRQYSNYLTPKVGMFSADSWALSSTLLRNLLLNFLVFFPLLLLSLLAPMFLAGYLAGFMNESPDKVTGLFWYAFTPAAILMGFSAFFIGRNLAYRIAPGKPQPSYLPEGSVIGKIVLPLYASAILLSLTIWFHEDIYGAHWYAYAVGLGLCYLIPMLAGWYMTEKQERASSRKKWRYAAWMLLSALAWLSLLYGAWVLLNRFDREFTPNIWYILTIGPSLVCLVYVITVTVHIGLFGREFPDEKREWWSRLGAWLLISMFAWTAFFALVLLGAPVLLWTGTVGMSLISTGWLASSLWGLLTGGGARTKGGSGNKLEFMIKVTPYVFVIGLLMFCSLVLSLICIQLSGQLNDYLGTALGTDMDFSGLLMNHVYFITSIDHSVFMNVALICMFVSVLFLWRIDINHFSMHLLYRNRLVRCYLGASNKKRAPHKFTGFDPHDELKLHELTTQRGPYHIINTTLNLVGGKELAWQKRKAASFIFSPKYCGYELIRDKRQHGLEDKPRETVLKSAYQKTEDYAGMKKHDKGVDLGMAMAISGAAASPNMGYHSSRALTFLMTIFNVRLGWWCRNPLYLDKWKKDTAPWSSLYLIKELFGLTRYDTSCVYLSDGGHFDNLGIYELVRRRCQVIVACDAGCDKDLKFGDLGNALSKIRVDLGFHIDIDLSPIKEQKKHCAIGKILYRNTDGTATKEGTLIYIKAMKCDKAPADVRSYEMEHDNFPHESTVDQWFDEDQFESYRMLGLHTLQHICETVDNVNTIDKLHKAAQKYLKL